MLAALILAFVVLLSSFSSAGLAAEKIQAVRITEATAGTQDAATASSDSLKNAVPANAVPVVDAATVYCDSCADCTAKAAVPGARVVLTQNVTYDGLRFCVDVTADDVSFDCAGHEITALQYYIGAVRLKGSRANPISRAAVSNCVLTKTSDGIFADNAEQCVLTNNVVSETDMALSLQDSVHCTLRGNKIIHGDSIGTLFSSFYVNNGASGEKKFFEHDVDESNLVDGKPIYYYVDEPNLRVVGERPGMIYCVNCSNALIANNSFEGPNGGITVIFTRNATIEYNEFFEASEHYGLGGIMLSPGLNQANGSDYVKIRRNFLRGCYNAITILGAYWDFAVGNEVTDNVIQNTVGNAVTADYYSSGFLIARNTIAGCDVGMSLSGGNAVDVTVTQNSVADCDYGFYLIYGAGLKIFHNQVIRSRVYPVYSYVPPAELSHNMQGNYWGRSEKPLFVPGVDSNDARVKDSCPYNRFYAEGKWPASPACPQAEIPPVHSDSQPRGRKPAVKLS